MLDLAGHQTKGLGSPSPIARRSVLFALAVKEGPRAAVQFKIIADLAPFAGSKSHTGRNRRLFDVGNLGRFGFHRRAQDRIFDLVLNLVRREWRYDDQDIRLARGEEMGRFLLGSTVVMLFPKGVLRARADWLPGRSVRMGEAMAEALR